ncbi:6-carboxy-5,6,7,8-tetrahydropterin synthase [Leptospira kirschneri serovar Mozdok]|nr:6-carboxy-5,6,7,8-tetrahydropterin synthase [Leptospira kirschneri serovar Mozdok]KON76929.1 6-carboxy-5,6,7,8-tetrahydropterin synthase [Leptospira kirschneri serovar Mozdok]
MLQKGIVQCKPFAFNEVVKIIALVFSYILKIGDFLIVFLKLDMYLL